MKHNNSKLLAYMQGIGLAIIVIAPFALIQNLIVIGEFQVVFIIIPFIVALVLGSLIGMVFWLRRNLEDQGKLFKAVADFAFECSYIQGRDGRFRYISPAVKRLTGYSASDMMADPAQLDRMVHPDDAALWAEHRARLWETQELEVIEFRFVTADGDVRWARHYAGPVIDENGGMVSLRATTIDITRQKDNENHIRMLADYDPLTELPNRRHLQRELDGILRRAEQQNSEFCVIFMDLDRFKYINDAHGHSVGDNLLIKLAQRLRSACKPDVLLGRFGGDEFIFVLPLGSTREDAEVAARKLLTLADEPFIQGGMRFSVGASFGIASYPADGINAESLIKNADAAMYQAKRVSEDIRFFSQEMGDHAAAAVQWETLLREAISRNEIEVHYQPIVDIATGRVEAVEALARWRQPDGSHVSPMTFIPLAEEIGLIHRLDAQIAEKACAQLRAWREAGHDIKVSVNTSARRFQQADFCEDMFHIIREAGLRPQDIKVELTESTLVEDLDNSRVKIATLRQNGVEVAIDDFGTGFSSLGYLTSLPMDTLKMDRSFISAMTRGKRHRAVVDGVLRLAGSLDMTVVAEGIETADQQRMLTDMGCESGQGFFFARPMTAADTERYLGEQRRDT